MENSLLLPLPQLSKISDIITDIDLPRKLYFSGQHVASKIRHTTELWDNAFPQRGNLAGIPLKKIKTGLILKQLTLQYTPAQPFLFLSLA